MNDIIWTVICQDYLNGETDLMSTHRTFEGARAAALVRADDYVRGMGRDVSLTVHTEEDDGRQSFCAEVGVAAPDQDPDKGFLWLGEPWTLWEVERSTLED